MESMRQRLSDLVGLDKFQADSGRIMHSLRSTPALNISPAWLNKCGGWGLCPFPSPRSAILLLSNAPDMCSACSFPASDVANAEIHSPGLLLVVTDDF